MNLSEIIFVQESMWETMNFLAKSEKVMFIQKKKNSKLQKEDHLQKYASDTVNRCQELHTKIHFLEDTMTKFNFEKQELDHATNFYIDAIDKHRIRNSIEGEQLFTKYERELNRNYDIISKHIENRDQLIKKTVYNLEKLEAVKLSEKLLPEDFASRDTNFDDNDDKKLFAFFGLIPTENLFYLQKILFRLMRGNLFFKYANLDISEYFREDELNGLETKPKSLIFILTPAGENDLLKEKIEKILLTNNFEQMDIPYNVRKVEIKIEAEQEVNDNRDILSKTNKEIIEILENLESENEISNLKLLSVCKLVISREMNFCKKLIFLEKQENLYSLMIWVPKKYYEYISKELNNIRSEDESFTKPKLIKHDIKDANQLSVTKIPTYFDNSVFTSPFQEIVDTYGVPRYQEANPALFTIISFPFFFGLMFGDVGHGSFILLAGCLLLHVKDPNSTLYRVKWLIFLMGLFAVYCGLIYSEFFATPLPLFNSCYNVNSENFEKKEPDCVYPFGLDYVWYLSSNETSFLNSFKMKFSIIIGVIQMLFGTSLKATNALYFSKWEDLIFEAIPQFLFMFVTFGYMSFCIIYKWLINWDGRNPPSIIQLFINFTNVEEPLYGDGHLQQTLQNIFVITCFVCLFLMILPKPIVVYLRQKKETKKGTPLSHHDEDIESKNALFSKNLIQKGDENSLKSEDNISHEEHSHSHSFGELMVDQLIETIEYALGSISNTASYLRLWALSLAHGQLAKVFYTMILASSIQSSSSVAISTIGITIGFVVFFAVTCAVILMMDSMECFLHGLRLHWVEFQNKFFKGDGIAFEGFKHSIHQPNKK